MCSHARGTRRWVRASVFCVPLSRMCWAWKRRVNSRARILIPSSRCFSYLDLKNSENFPSPPSLVVENTVVKTTAILGVSPRRIIRVRGFVASSTGNHVKLFYLVESYKHAIAGTWWPMLAIQSSVALIATDVKSELNSANGLKWRLDRSSCLIIFSRRYLRTAP